MPLSLKNQLIKAKGECSYCVHIGSSNIVAKNLKNNLTGLLNYCINSFFLPQNLLFSIFFSKWKLHRRKDLVQFTEKSLPGVSILKPLVNSADPSLFQNLETFFLLDYPKYEIIFCIQCTESEDSRLKMYVDSLRNKYPSVQSKVS